MVAIVGQGSTGQAVAAYLQSKGVAAVACSSLPQHLAAGLDILAPEQLPELVAKLPLLQQQKLQQTAQKVAVAAAGIAAARTYQAPRPLGPKQQAKQQKRLENKRKSEAGQARAKARLQCPWYGQALTSMSLGSVRVKEVHLTSRSAPTVRELMAEAGLVIPNGSSVATV